MINQRGDVRHSFILWWIILFVVWVSISGLIASAQTVSLDNSLPIMNTTDLNSSDSLALAEDSDNLISNLVAFHVNNKWINIIFAISGAYVIWVTASVYFGVGG